VSLRLASQFAACSINADVSSDPPALAPLARILLAFAIASTLFSTPKGGQAHRPGVGISFALREIEQRAEFADVDREPGTRPPCPKAD
jgi:hypothetical protein